MRSKQANIQITSGNVWIRIPSGVLRRLNIASAWNAFEARSVSPWCEATAMYTAYPTTGAKVGVANADVV